ncbi:MAG: putative spermidine/putrescine transport system substrate-binding protein [Acetobacteraceae bacterium]|jgi:putative spermidine/putrescine transport system substrate-binding protein|nr:putative spermidine/putrescine transport system substrate-binding protein [Acetobacteraceae bacterium]
MSIRIGRRGFTKAATAALATPTILSSRAWADGKSIQVGIYTAQQGEYVRKQIIPQFQTDYNCRVFTTEGVTLSQIAALRATRSNPKYSAMFMDDIGIDLAKKEGLLDPLPVDKIPNLERVYKRFLFSEGYGAAFAISTGGLYINPQNDPKITSYGDLWQERFRKRVLMITPKFTQSIYMLVATTSMVTGKPLKEAQYLTDAGWDKIADLKPNILTIYEAPATVMMVAQGQADVGGIEYSKNIYPYTVAGAPIDMVFPKEGTFAGINCLSFVKGAPEPELGAAFINRMLEPSVQQGLAEATLTAPSISGLNLKPDAAKYAAYPESKMDDMGLFACDWAYVNPRRPAWLEKYNQIFGS